MPKSTLTARDAGLRACRAVLPALLGAIVAAGPLGAQNAPNLEPAATALYPGRTVELAEVLADPNDLWTTPEDLTRINDFVLKPEGACLDDLCVPVRQDEDSELFVRRQERGWFNVSGLARRLGQAYVHDPETETWSFAAVPVVLASTLESARAPDFELLDKDGVRRRLSDFRGRKVAIVTWASW